MGIIYIFTFPNGKRYIGQTANLKQRYTKYRYNKKDHTPIYNAIRKYGWENILKDEIECPNEFLDEVEITWIKNFDTLFPNGYNVALGGNNLSHKQSKEWSENKRREMIGNQYAKGIKHTEERKKAFSEKMTGRKQAPEHTAKSTLAKLKPVLQLSKEGQLIKEWSSAKEASESLGITRSLICRVIKNGKNAGGFKWAFKCPTTS